MRERNLGLVFTPVCREHGVVGHRLTKSLPSVFAEPLTAERVKIPARVELTLGAGLGE